MKRRGLRDEHGYGLIEVLAAGMIFSLISLLAVRGFLVASDLMLRSEVLKKQMEAVEARVEYGEPADQERERVLIFRAEDGAAVRIPVKEAAYQLHTDRFTAKWILWKAKGRSE